jgi:putative hydroxymethylpyrimidine transport system substrate-binding protein
VRAPTRRRRRHGGTVQLRIVVLLAALAMVVVGCGGDGDGGGQAATGTTAPAGTCDGQKLASMTSATLILDFLPNPVHVAIYQAWPPGPTRPTTST